MPTRRTILEWVYHWEKTAPDRIWLTQPMGGGPVKTWTWAEALDEARRMATYLKGLGLPDKSPIALCSKNCAYWMLTDLAIWMAGHVSVPVYPTLTADTVQAILEHSESKLLFVGKLDMWDTMKAGVPTGLPMVNFPLSPPNDFTSWEKIIADNGPLTESPARDPEELGTLIYTSGSTGTPKGVMLTFGAMNVCAENISNMLEFTPEDRLLSYLPLAHSLERFLIEHGGMAGGSKIFFAEALDTFVQDLQRARPTLFASVPRLWLKFQLGVFSKLPQKKLNFLLKIPIVSGIIKKKVLGNLGLDCVRFAGSGSAPIPKEVLDWYRRLGLELLEAYGMTENFACSHISRPGAVRVGYVGQPYPGVEHRIGEGGEIQIKSPGNMLGYYKAPELTKETFTEDGWLKTGDQGEIDDQDRLKITGRLKELFKTSKGKYVAPAPIENIIMNHGRVEAACVTGANHPSPFGLVLLSEDDRANLKAGGSREAVQADLEQLFQKVNNQVDPHERLAFLLVVKDEWQIENGFLTPTMKLKRRKIEDVYGDKQDGWYGEKKQIIWEA